MNILMISDVYFPRVNGVSTSIQSFAREMRRLNHKVTLITPEYPGQPWYDEPFDIIRLPSRYLPFDPEDRLMHYRAVMQLFPQLELSKFDILHIHTPFVAHYAGLRLARRLGIPTVETYHTYFEEYFHLYMPFLPRMACRGLARLVSRSQCNAVDSVVVPTHAIETVLADYGVTAPMTVLPTGLDLREFSQGDGVAFRAKHGIPPETPLLVHVSRVAHEKNIDFILRMFAELRRQRPEVRLVIAGEGPALNALKKMAAQLHIADAVMFVGYLDRRGELMDAYRAADVFVFASRTETQGLVLLEAMALGVPVVSTAALGTKEVLCEGAGALIAPEHELAFAARVLEVLDDPQRRHHLSLAACEYASSWSAPRKAEELAVLYRRLIDEFGIVREPLDHDTTFGAIARRRPAPER